MKPTIGLSIMPQHGDMKAMREAWIEAEAIGVDALYSGDHFHAQVVSAENATKGQVTDTSNGKNFEGMMMQAAMAATTTRAEIGCIVHAVGYRNPNLLADMARTIDHISGGRYVLGIGAGYLKEDYDEYGYPYGTTKSRLEDLARALPIIKARFGKLNPKPVRKIPILVASMGEKIGLRIVAEHADIWHVFGPLDKIREKREVLFNICREIGRAPATLEITASCLPQVIPDNDPDVMYRELGIKHLVSLATGPNWDLGAVRELLEWRNRLR